MNKAQIILQLKTKFDSYTPIDDVTWSHIEPLIKIDQLDRGQTLLRNGQVAKHIHFVSKGSLIAYYSDSEGNTYNKNIFFENDLAGSTVSCILQTPSEFTIEAIENTTIVSINYTDYRKLIFAHDILKTFYVAYLEKNWVIEKEQREISLVLDDATERYNKLLELHPDVDQRIPQKHIASHLGITPTQLSRIRKLKK